MVFVPPPRGEEVVVFHAFVVKSRAALVLAALCVAAPVFAQGSAEASTQAQDPQAALRAQVEQLRQQLEALQKKVAELEGARAGRPGAPAAGAPGAVPTVPPPQTVPTTPPGEAA